ncbi:PPK2 family polyphosphate kinase [Sediminivirga luteola]|uniref:Polyphosphate kinase-2-related domain-containing protein n=1 Tax=Sediminivirga luteola TaxID=1774748 RepID=A0A8J2TWY3_9MICO|nr:PPK2 family polyphosphate kinase [Sediminivirga luteola]MCI2265478.1 polyphosphate kinase 2 family protein [Sediminivirga luteola]GGA10330.1 hypothetical protein GCM10011333_11300 [Sediminivirga luteola]
MVAMSQRRWIADARASLLVGEDVRLGDIDPESTPGYDGNKREGRRDLFAGAEQLGDYQERLYAAAEGGGAEDAVLLVLQGMDTSGKGGIVRHVIGAVDPQGVDLAAFKAPTEEELAHDFLWRVERRVPGAGRIGVFDRSHYEDVLIGRVRRLAPEEEIERRYGAIREFEERLAAGGTRIVKVMLHISPEHQRERLQNRLERPDKHWKYHPSDVDERLLWDDYQRAYEVAIARTSTPAAPWFVVPADRRWYARLAVQALLLETLEDIDPQWPAADYDIEAEKARLAAT